MEESGCEKSKLSAIVRSVSRYDDEEEEEEADRRRGCGEARLLGDESELDDDDAEDSCCVALWRLRGDGDSDARADSVSAEDDDESLCGGGRAAPSVSDPGGVAMPRAADARTASELAADAEALALSLLDMGSAGGRCGCGGVARRLRMGDVVFDLEEAADDAEDEEESGRSWAWRDSPLLREKVGDGTDEMADEDSESDDV